MKDLYLNGIAALLAAFPQETKRLIDAFVEEENEAAKKAGFIQMVNGEFEQNFTEYDETKAFLDKLNADSVPAIYEIKALPTFPDIAINSTQSTRRRYNRRSKRY